LKRLAGELGVADRLIWQESTSEIAVVYNALDVFVSSSQRRIAKRRREAMACGVPCVATDVGDSRALSAIAASSCRLRKLKRLPREISSLPQRGQINSAPSPNRIIENFSTQSLASVTAEAISALTVNGTSSVDTRTNV